MTDTTLDTIGPELRPKRARPRRASARRARHPDIIDGDPPYPQDEPFTLCAASRIMRSSTETVRSTLAEATRWRRDREARLSLAVPGSVDWDGWRILVQEWREREAALAAVLAVREATGDQGRRAPWAA